MLNNFTNSLQMQSIMVFCICLCLFLFLHRYLPKYSYYKQKPSLLELLFLGLVIFIAFKMSLFLFFLCKNVKISVFVGGFEFVQITFFIFSTFFCVTALITLRICIEVKYLWNYVTAILFISGYINLILSLLCNIENCPDLKTNSYILSAFFIIILSFGGFSSYIEHLRKKTFDVNSGDSFNFTKMRLSYTSFINLCKTTKESMTEEEEFSEGAPASLKQFFFNLFAILNHKSLYIKKGGQHFKKIYINFYYNFCLINFTFSQVTGRYPNVYAFLASYAFLNKEITLVGLYFFLFSLHSCFIFIMCLVITNSPKWYTAFEAVCGCKSLTSLGFNSTPLSFGLLFAENANSDFAGHDTKAPASKTAESSSKKFKKKWFEPNKKGKSIFNSIYKVEAALCLGSTVVAVGWFAVSSFQQAQQNAVTLKVSKVHLNTLQSEAAANDELRQIKLTTEKALKEMQMEEAKAQHKNKIQELSNESARLAEEARSAENKEKQAEFLKKKASGFFFSKK